MEEKQNRQYITSKVHPIFENILVDLLMSKPDDVIGFMLKWLKEKGPAYGQGGQDNQPHQTLDIFKAGYKAKNDEENPSSEEEEEDQVEDLPGEIIRKQNNNPTGRSSVSAEAFGQFHKKEEFKPVYVKKTQEQVDKITKRIMQSFMFSALDEKDREIVIGSMVQRNYQTGEYIIRQGDDGDLLFILETGSADCYKRFQKNEEPRFLKTYVPGESFGELSLLYNCPRAASIVAKTPCMLWGLDRSTFNHIVKDAAMKKREKFEDFLSKKILLLKWSHMDPYERLQIADALKTIKAKKGEYVVRQGEEGDIFFIIEEGECDAYIQEKPGDEPKKVKEYHKEQFFGELALIKNQPRAASVVCKTDCTLVALDRYTFKRLLGPIDEILKRNADTYKKYGEV